MSTNVAQHSFAQVSRTVFHPVLRADALRDKPVRVTVSGVQYALFRTTGGKAAAVRDRCPHRFAALSGGTVRPDGRLACPYHGWHFDADGHGVSPSQPSLKRCDVEAMRVEEGEGYLWLGHKEAPSSSLPPIRPTDRNYEFAGTFALELASSLEHALDIFSDAEHPAWVHGRLAWTEAQVDQIRYEHSVEEHSSSVQTSGPQRSTVMSRLLGIRPGDRFNNHWTTRFDPVRAEFSMFWTDEKTGDRRPLRLRIAVFLVPVAERKTDLHAFVYASLDHPLRHWLMPAIKKLVVYAGRTEAREDQEFLRNMLDAPTTAKGMRLGSLDRAIAYNRNLLSRLYYVREGNDATAGVGRSDGSERGARGRSLQLAE